MSQKDYDMNPRWYVVHTYSGYENKVKKDLENTIKNRELEEYFFDIIVPMEEQIEIKDGKKKTNLKKVFLNNIKGKRGYIKGISTQVDRGENFYKKTRRTSAKLADNPVGLIIAPIPTIFGAVIYSINLVGSPIFAIWAKGSRISIPAGSEFEIKLLEDVYLQ